VTEAGFYPLLNAFANGLYANPNPRIFPQSKRFDFTLELVVRLTWTINDTFSTFGAAAEAESKVDAARAQRGQLEDGIRIEVTQSFYDMKTARSAIDAAKQRERSARTNLVIRRLQFRAGDATATDLIDAEAQLIESILQRIDAHVDYLVAETRLEFAAGGPL
ncbi:MAG: TolC family protein, partial [Myxococcota bacterium]